MTNKFSIILNACKANYFMIESFFFRSLCHLTWPDNFCRLPCDESTLFTWGAPLTSRQNVKYVFFLLSLFCNSPRSHSTWLAWEWYTKRKGCAKRCRKKIKFILAKNMMITTAFERRKMRLGGLLYCYLVVRSIFFLLLFRVEAFCNRKNEKVRTKS